MSMNDEIKVTSFTPQPWKVYDTVHKNRKENALWRSVIVVRKPDMAEVLTLRLYHPGACRVYACVWANIDDIPAVAAMEWEKREKFAHGAGDHVDGWGYHKPSAAAEYALRRLGFKFDRSFGGHGDGAVKEACLAAARTMTIAQGRKAKAKASDFYCYTIEG